MCRWLAYSGSDIPLADLVTTPAHSLIHQSHNSTMGATVLNADGFGIGWYSHHDPTPAMFHSIRPAWSDPNLADLARHIRSPLFMAHVRASTGTAVSENNCHPFRYGRWLWMHNGAVRDFPRVKRDLILAIDPLLYPLIQGSTDSEVLFYLALTFGLDEDPQRAVSQMVGFVEAVGHANGVEAPIQMTVATSDGRRLWSFRYSSEGRSRTLYYSADVTTVRILHPDVKRLHEVSDEARIIVSEPLFDLPGVWKEVPESSWGVVQDGDDILESFSPAPPD